MFPPSAPVPPPSPQACLPLPPPHLTSSSNQSCGYVRTHDPRPALRRENGDSGIHNLVNFSSPLVPGPFPPLSLPLFLTSPRPGHDFPDPLVKVYDLRNMRPLPPIPFSDGPAIFNLLPMQTSSLVATSAQCLANVVDMPNTNISGSHHVRPPSIFRPHFPPTDLQLDTTSYITSTAVSSNGSYLGFGDAVGTIHLLTTADESSEPFFNNFQGQPAEWTDVPEPPPKWTGRIPHLSSTHRLPKYHPRFWPQSRSTTMSHMRLSQKSSEDGDIASSFPLQRINTG